MANYNSYQRTSYFSVTDEDKLREIAERFGAEVVTNDQQFALLDKGENDIYTTYCEDCDDMIDIEEELQSILPDDEAAILFEVGYEKMRYLIGHATVVTNKDINGLSLENGAIELATKMTGKSPERIWY